MEITGNLYEVNYEDTLYIKSKFSECGEWGGHDEVIKDFLVKERKTMLRFERNEVIDCDIRNSKGDIVKKGDILIEISSTAMLVSSDSPVCSGIPRCFCKQNLYEKCRIRCNLYTTI